MLMFRFIYISQIKFEFEFIFGVWGELMNFRLIKRFLAFGLNLNLYSFRAFAEITTLVLILKGLRSADSLIIVLW